MNGNTLVEKRSLRKWWLVPARKSALPEAAIFAADHAVRVLRQVALEGRAARGQQAEDEHRDEARDAEAGERRDDAMERPGRQHDHDPDHCEHDERADEAGRAGDHAGRVGEPGVRVA